MPKIKSFRGIRPNPEYVKEVVLEVENLSLETAKAIREENPYSYVNMLVPKLDNRFLMGSKRELAYKKINENFEEFLDNGILIRDSEPSLYVYQIKHKGIRQTGIWAVTCIDDYLNNTVKKHELTRSDRENALKDYLQQTGVDANPVLITFPPDDFISSIIQQKTELKAELHFQIGGAEHSLWKIDAEDELRELIKAFSEMPASYIADGHHRAAAASLFGMERRRLNLKHNGKEEYNFFNSVFMATDQLRILEFNRLVKDTGSYNEEQFLSRLAEDFIVSKSGSQIVKPSKLHEFGMYFHRNWYKLEPLKLAISDESPVSDLDVTILQDNLLCPILRISDPRTDPRISFWGGINPVEELMELVDSGEYALAFTLYPTSIEQLIRVADAGEVMPPKSTWFEPKFQAGLVIHQIN